MYKDFYSIFNGFKDKDIGIETIKRPNIPTTIPIFNSLNIKGKEGSLNEFVGFEDLKIQVDYNFYSLKKINDIWRNIKNWFLNIEDNKLKFSDDPDVFYKVKKVILPENIERCKTIGRLTVTYICEPFCYLEEGLQEIYLEKGENYLYNFGTYFSKPIFKINAEGIVTLKINDKKIVTANVGQNLIIDTALELSYKNEINSIRNNLLKGRYKDLFFDVGDNLININVEGRLDSIEVIPNWRSY